MAPSQSKLAEALNTLIENGRAVVSEPGGTIAVNQLSGPDAHQVMGLLEAAGWTDTVVEDQGGEIPRDHVERSGSGVRVTARRPPVPAGIEAVVTLAGFGSLLDRPPTAAVVWVQGLTMTIETLTVRYSPWENDTAFAPIDDVPSPARVVRVLGRNGPGSDIGRWLLRAPATDVHGVAASAWRVRASSRLLRSLAQEIEPDERILFTGPPAARFSVAAAEELTPQYFAATQSVAGWVFESERELENRHALLAAEVARTAMKGGDAQDLASVLATALEGARIAYRFGVTQQSRDVLRALGELRKAVSDDATRLSEATRTVAGAVMGAVFGNIGLIVARVSLPANANFVGPAAVLLGAVLAIYVIATIGSGWHYLAVQRSLRTEWKGRLYRFLPDDDYRRLVEEPVGKAETLFWWTAGVGFAMSSLLLIAVYLIATAPVA